MRVKQLTSPADLPSEFKIEKYVTPADAGYWYWVAMLEARGLRRYMASLGDSYKAEIRGACMYMFNDPQWPSRLWPRGNSGLRRHVEASHIRDFTLKDLYCLGVDAEGERLRSYKEAWHVYESWPASGDVEKASALLDKPMYESFREAGYMDLEDVYARVDLRGSEEKIVDDFRQWLQTTQRAMGLSMPKRRISKSDFDSWTRYQILAYLDLTLWAKVNDFELTQNLIGLALFPNEYDVSLAERVRKTVSPIARSISNENFTDMLRSQALEAEPKSPELIPDKWGSVLVAEDGQWVFSPE